MDQLTENEFAQFQEFIYQHAGIRVRDNKQLLLSNRIRRRLRALPHIETFHDYFHFLQTRPTAELTAFLDVVTTNETSFFRTESHFQWFREDFLPELIQQARSKQRKTNLRVWSAACSSGEEPYTLAICLAENQLRLRDWSLEIVGTDLSESILQKAIDGRYDARAMDGLSDTQKRRYFEKPDANGQFSAKAAIRSLVQFRKHNLIQSFSGEKFDCIFIRNVLIYFDRESKLRVVNNLLAALKPGGYLVVGPSEGIYDLLSACRKIKPFLYQYS